MALSTRIFFIELGPTIYVSMTYLLAVILGPIFKNPNRPTTGKMAACFPKQIRAIIHLHGAVFYKCLACETLTHSRGTQSIDEALSGWLFMFCGYYFFNRS